MSLRFCGVREHAHCGSEFTRGSGFDSEIFTCRMRRSGSARRESAFNMTLMSGDDTGSAALADCSSLKRQV